MGICRGGKKINPSANLSSFGTYVSAMIHILLTILYTKMFESTKAKTFYLSLVDRNWPCLYN